MIIRSFASQDLLHLSAQFCADSSSPQISATLRKTSTRRVAQKIVPSPGSRITTNRIAIITTNRIAIITNDRTAIITNNRIAIITTNNRIAIITTNRVAINLPSRTPRWSP